MGYWWGRLRLPLRSVTREMLAQQLYRRSVREDVAPGGELRPLEEIPLVDYDVSWASENRDSILMSWAFYLGGEETP